LFADSVDFLEDASVNLLILLALGWSLRARARVGMGLAAILLVPALATLWALWSKLHLLLPPTPVPLTLTGLGAMAVNFGCATLLARFRHHSGSLTRAAFLSTQRRFCQHRHRGRRRAYRVHPFGLAGRGRGRRHHADECRRGARSLAGGAGRTSDRAGLNRPPRQCMSDGAIHLPDNRPLISSICPESSMRWLLPLLAVFTLAACTAAPSAQATGNVDKLTTIDQKVGTGAEAKNGMQVTVHYTGWLYDDSAKDKHGAKFDSSRDHGEPFSFMLGQGSVIAGWDQGVAGMREGGKRILLIPAELGYGARGAGDDIPPNASLVFEVELLKVGD
jgi:FKBP-type peptidyl-prolyl cis-trans isomerase FkpA